MGMLLLLHINQIRLRDQNLQQNQMAAYGADNARARSAGSPYAAPAAGGVQEKSFIPAASPSLCCL